MVKRVGGIGLYRSRLKNCRFRGVASGGGGSAAADANARRVVATVLRQRTAPPYLTSHARPSPIERGCAAAVDWSCGTTGCVHIAHRSFQRFRLRKPHAAAIGALRAQGDGSTYSVRAEHEAANGSTQVGSRVSAASAGAMKGGAMRAENGDAAASSEWADGGAVELAATRCSTRPSAPLECGPI